MRPGKIVLLVLGALLALIGLPCLAAGGTLLWVHATQRDAAGFYTTPVEQLRTTTYALTSEADFGAQTSQHDWVPVSWVGTVRLRTAASPGQSVFVGIAPTTSVDRYLSGVAHTHVTSLSYGPFTTEEQPIGGTRAPPPPSTGRFWVASVSGPGSRTLVWPVQPGKWSAVVMNADASRGVAVGVDVGVETGILLPVGIGIGVVGLLALAGCALCLFFGIRRTRAQEVEAAPSGSPHPVPELAGAGSAATPPQADRAAPYPVQLDGHLDPGVSRWLWLFKWLLVIPHVLVLALLWIAVAVLTVVAGFAILFTGRYPRSIFEFNVGVVRWTWRVSFYAINAFGTDRYPPFSLDHDPAYPADLSVDYPDHLSRGLVLVKWWLLALPQYFVVAIFAGGWGFGQQGAWRIAGTGGGLIALLALIAVVILAFGGTYPESIFDFVMGLNRWCFRVLAYVLLMRDEYPPFRLDTGGTDPGTGRSGPPLAPGGIAGLRRAAMP